MDPELKAEFRLKASQLWMTTRTRLARTPATARVVLGLFLFAAVLMALHTAFAGKDSSLHLRVQHSFRSADISVAIDGSAVYSGKLRGSLRKKFGLIPDSIQGNLSEILPLASGAHQIRVRVVADDGTIQEDSTTADFPAHSERELSVTARRSAITLAWQSGSTSPSPSGSGWLERYAGTLFLTAAGSIISALTGFALKELPGHIRSRQSVEPKEQSAAAGQ
jgi:hypothetical protein